MSEPSPELSRWCRGICERELPLGAFEMNGAYRRWVCRVCRRHRERLRFRRRYHNDSAVRRANIRKAREYYTAHTELVRAQRRARYWDQKVAGAAA